MANGNTSETHRYFAYVDLYIGDSDAVNRPRILCLLLDTAASVKGIHSVQICELGADGNPIVRHAGYRIKVGAVSRLPSGMTLAKETKIVGCTVRRSASRDAPPEDRTEMDALARAVEAACRRALAERPK